MSTGSISLDILLNLVKQDAESGSPDEFYLSRNEKSVADEMFQNGKLYLIYRIYNLDVTTGNGDLMIFEPPFDEERYSLKPENWKVSYKRR